MKKNSKFLTHTKNELFTDVFLIRVVAKYQIKNIQGVSKKNGAVFFLQISQQPSIGFSNHFGASVRRSSGRRSGGRLLANDVVATISISLFSFFFPPRFFPVFFSSVATFSHRRSARIKILISRELTRAPNT